MSKKSDHCFQKGLLKRVRKEPTFAIRSLERAQKILHEIPELVEMELFENAVQRIYQAAFHAVRRLALGNGSYLSVTDSVS